MNSKPPKCSKPPTGHSSNKTVVREVKEKSSLSRFKKLKRRISAGLGRLGQHKGDNTGERNCEDDMYQENGIHSLSTSCSSREMSQSPPVFARLNCTPNDETFHTANNMDQSLANVQSKAQEDILNSSIVTSMPKAKLSLSSSHSGEKCSSDNYFSNHAKTDDYTTNSISHQNDNQEHPRFAVPDKFLEDRYSFGEPHPSVQNLKHSPVKRHHSTGDMLSTDIEYTVVQRRVRRPKSEGNFYVEAFHSKRASSFGYNSPFGKEDAYDKLERLGEGSYATVHKGISLLTNKVVALKEIRLQPEEGTPFTAIREASLLKELKHANIVTLHDIIHTKDTLTFVFEFVHTDLSQYLEKHPGGLNPRNVKLFLFQLLRGLAFCHQRQVLHRDLKPQNMLISEIGELKLADFGLARAKSIPSRTYSHEVVTLWYRPPDVLLGSTDYTTSLDIWGMGCIFTEMVSGIATFPGMKDVWDQLDRIWRVLGTPTEDTWEGVADYPNYCREKFGLYLPHQLSWFIPKLAHIPYAEMLAHEILQLQPHERPSAENCMHHLYFSDLPTAIYELNNYMSIFDVTGISLAPEMDEFLRTKICTNAQLKGKISH